MAFENPMTSSLVSPSMLKFLHVILVLYSISSLLPMASSISIAALGNETDRFALLKFKESISRDPYGVLSSWNDSVHFCNWRGISCGKRHQRTTALNLQDHNLRGTMSPFIGNLTFLRSIRLENNNFFGEIPQQVGRLFRLQHLNLTFNMMEGKIPINISYCSHLSALSLRNNNLTGMIPSELGSLAKLIHLNLANNRLSGALPPSLGNISSLSVLSVPFNNLMGTVPDELGKLKSLILISIGPNNLSGTIPLSIYNISSVKRFSVVGNQLKGTLPPTIGLTLPNIQQFFIGRNGFSGIIPNSFSNVSQLQVLDIPRNNFVGQVPASLGSLQNLWWLGLGVNDLGNSLDFISSLTNCSQLKILDCRENKFVGILPNSVANLSTTLTELYLGLNQISGNIPSELENLVNLIGFGVENNLFTGAIPHSLGKLQNLQALAFRNNRLSGYIPSSLGNLTKIFHLDLSNNKLEGNIPPNIVDCQNLQYLDISNNSLSATIPNEVFGIFTLVLLNLSQNSLTGSLPVDVGKLNNINALDFSVNNLTNEIPETIGDCQSLEFLYLQCNYFQGSIPSTLASLRGIQYLDLSRNNLTGKIPEDLQKLGSMLFLNLSFNNLEGEVPKEGVFLNASAISVVGNTRLCSGATLFKLQPCPVEKLKEGRRHHLKVMVAIICAGTIFVFLTSLIVFHWKKSTQRQSSTTLSKISSLPKVSYKRLFQATNGFSPSMLIGTGSFGSVFKGILDQEENLVAIKVLNLQQKGASKSFINECNALRNIRHRNLVKILTCCSSMDYNGHEFKALVFEYMSNGSLDQWLHPMPDTGNCPRVLSLVQRLNIVSDVASALCYLHDDCDQPILHCDLKPSNVLLDDEMNAHVSDFGLARLISNAIISSESHETSISGIKGTIGYVAPEYATGGEPSKQGDVYSYGIFVLEMFTGRIPTDRMFKDNFNLHNFVKMALPEGLMQIVDSVLLTSLRSEDGINDNNHNRRTEIEVEEGNINQISAHVQKCLVSILEIGLACSKESPNERMNIGDAAKGLQHIKNVYMSANIRGRRRGPAN